MMIAKTKLSMSWLHREFFYSDLCFCYRDWLATSRRLHQLFWSGYMAGVPYNVTSSAKTCRMKDKSRRPWSDADESVATKTLLIIFKNKCIW